MKTPEWWDLSLCYDAGQKPELRAGRRTRLGGKDAGTAYTFLYVWKFQLTFENTRRGVDQLMARGSYRGLLRLPAWGLYGPSGELIATCRAVTAEDARDLFHRYVGKMPELLDGRRIRRLK